LLQSSKSPLLHSNRYEYAIHNGLLNLLNNAVDPFAVVHTVFKTMFDFPTLK